RRSATWGGVGSGRAVAGGGVAAGAVGAVATEGRDGSSGGQGSVSALAGSASGGRPLTILNTASRRPPSRPSVSPMRKDRLITSRTLVASVLTWERRQRENLRVMRTFLPTDILLLM